MQELDPTHQRVVDIGLKGYRYVASGREYVEIDANAWLRPCDDHYWGTPCECQQECERS